MEVLHSGCAGLDVHKKTVVACRITRNGAGRRVSETRTFSTMTRDLLGLGDWLQEGQCTHVAMESTGDYWKPVYNILEERFEVLLVNARHVKAVPGRKTDVKDSEWIAQLLEHGLLRPSFVPPAPQRELRELTRQRSNFLRDRASLANRVQRVLEQANIKLASVVSDIMGVSSRAILDALMSGERDVSALSRLAKGRLREKRELLEHALEGRFREHHRLILSELLCQMDSLDESITRLNAAIEERTAPFAEVVECLDEIPGVGRVTAEIMVSEMGIDMSRFPTEGHLSSWAGVAPGNNESAGKQYSGRSRPGNMALRSALVQAAHAAAQSRDTYLSAQYRRLAARRGRKRAILAVAHSILVSAYHMIRLGQGYQELGGNYFDRRQPETTAKRLISRLEAIGYQVTVQPQAAAIAT